MPHFFQKERQLLLSGIRRLAVREWLRDQLFRKLFRNAGILLSGDVVSKLFGLVSLALTARALGPEQFGILVLVQTYAEIMGRLTSFQAWQGLIKYGAEALERNQTEAFKGFVKIGTLLDVGSGIAGTILAVCAASWVGRRLNWDEETVRMAVCYSFILLLNLTGTPTGIIRLFDKFKLFALQKTASAAIKLIAVGAAYLNESGLWTYVVIWMVTEIFNYVLLLFMGHFLLYQKGFGQWWRKRTPNWRPFFSFTWWTNLSSTLDIPVKQLDVFIVSAVVSLEGVGIYKIFKQVAQIVTKLADPFYQAIYPQFATMIATDREVQATKMAGKMGILLFGVCLPIVVLLSLTSSRWLALVFGEAYASEQTVLSVYLLLKALSLAFISIHPLFIAMGYVQKNFVILALANGFYLALAWFLGVRMELMGIVLAYGVQFSMVVILKLYFIRQRLYNHLHTVGQMETS